MGTPATEVVIRFPLRGYSKALLSCAIAVLSSACLTRRANRALKVDRTWNTYGEWGRKGYFTQDFPLEQARTYLHELKTDLTAERKQRSRIAKARAL